MRQQELRAIRERESKELMLTKWQDRSAVHIPLLRARNRQHFPCQLCHRLQHRMPVCTSSSIIGNVITDFQQSMLIRNYIHRDTAPPPHLPDIR